jgi:isopentenyl-diphosphate delta-isomerase
MNLDEHVVLITENDSPIGVAPKMHAHREGLLHRAFSVFVFDAGGATLLQRRNRRKYHSGGLWSYTCCGHPRPGESLQGAARRRLREEMGIDCELRRVTAFLYRADLGNGLIEHEIDHVFVGTWDGVPEPDPYEVEDYRWLSAEALDSALRRRPLTFTRWFSPEWMALLAADFVPRRFGVPRPQ